MAIDRLGLGDGRGSSYLKWCLTIHHQRLCGVMKITWALETDKFGFKFSLCHLLAMWCWTSQLVYLNLSFVTSDKETILLTSGGLLWRLRGNVCKAHRAVPGIQEALNVIYSESSPFWFLEASDLTSFLPEAPLVLLLVNIVNIQQKGQGLSVIQRPLCSLCFSKSRLKLSKLWVSSLSDYLESKLKDRPLLCVWSVYDVTLFEL